MISSAFAESTTDDIGFTIKVIADATMAENCVVVDGSDFSEIDLVVGENTFVGVYHLTTETTLQGTTKYGFFEPSFTLKVKDSSSETYTFSACTVTNSYNSSTTDHGSSYPNAKIDLTSGLQWVSDKSAATYTFNPTLTTLASLRTASATVNVDDASKVSVAVGGPTYVPTLSNGSNAVYFNPSNEYYWIIGPKVDGQYLESVSKNGKPLSPSGSNYYLSVADGDVIDIVATVVASTCNVTFTFENDGTQGAISGVYLGNNHAKGDAFQNWESGIQVDKNAEIIITLNQNDYNITAITKNGSSVGVNNDTYVQIQGDTEIHVTATQYSTQDVTFDLSNPASVLIQVAESQYGGRTDLEGLEEGSHVVAISEKMKYILISEQDGGVIDAVSYKAAGDADFTDAVYNYGYCLDLTPGMTVKVQSHMMARDKKASLYVNDISKIFSLNVKSTDGSTYLLSKDGYGGTTPVQGWNDFYFDPSADNPVELKYTYDMDYQTYVLVNGVKATPLYGAYTLTLSANDQIKVYVGDAYNAGALTVKSVNIDVDAPSKVVVKKSATQSADGAVTIDGLEAGAQGVELSSDINYLIITPADGEEISSVSYVAPGAANPTEVVANDGAYCVPVADGTVVSIATAGAGGGGGDDPVVPTNATFTLNIFNFSQIGTAYLQAYDNAYLGSTFGQGVTLVDGANEVEFDPSTQNPVTLYYYQNNNSNPSYVLVNSKKVEPLSATTYKLTLADGDVVELHPGEEYGGAPVTYNNFTLTLSNVDAVSVTVSETKNGTPTAVPALATGSNSLSIDDSMTYMEIEAQSGHVIDCITYRTAGSAVDNEVALEGNTYYVPLSDGMSINVTSHADAAASGKLIVYIHDISLLDGIYMQDNSSNNYVFNSYGYNGAIVPVDGLNEFDIKSAGVYSLSFSQKEYYDPCYVLVNGVRAIPTSAPSGYTLDLKPGDRVDVYPGATYNAAEHGNIVVYFSLTNAAMMEIGTAESAGATPSPLGNSFKNGSNEVEISNTTAFFTISPAANKQINSVSYTLSGSSNVVVVEPQGGVYYVPASDGMTITASASKVRTVLVRCMIYNLSKISYIDLRYADSDPIFSTSASVTPKEGMNEFYIDPTSDMPLQLCYYLKEQGTTGYVMLNNELLSPKYDGSTSYEVTMTKEGDELSIHPDITSTSVSDVEIDFQDHAEIYDLMGRRVRSDSNIAPGIYIMNGKKVIIK